MIGIIVIANRLPRFEASDVPFSVIAAEKDQEAHEENQKRMNKQAAESWGAFWLACMRNEEQKKQQQSNANLQVEEEQYVPQTQHHRSNQR